MEGRPSLSSRAFTIFAAAYGVRVLMMCSRFRSFRTTSFSCEFLISITIVYCSMSRNTAPSGCGTLRGQFHVLLLYLSPPPPLARTLYIRLKHVARLRRRISRGGDMSENEDATNDETMFSPEAGAPDPERYWDSDEALENLKMERQVNPDRDSEALCRKMLEDAAPMALQSIIHIALHSGNDNTRFNAAKYITDKVLEDDTAGTVSKWEQIVGEVVDQAELH